MKREPSGHPRLRSYLNIQIVLHGIVPNSVYTGLNTVIYIYTYIYIYEVNVMWIHNTDLGRRRPGGGRVLCRDYAPSFRHRLYATWTGGPVTEFRLLPPVVVGSISNDGDYGVHCCWNPIRSKQLFNVPYVACRCLLDFLVIYIYKPIILYKRGDNYCLYVHIGATIHIPASWVCKQIGIAHTHTHTYIYIYIWSWLSFDGCFYFHP